MIHQYPKILYHPSATYSVTVENEEAEKRVLTRWELDSDPEHVQMSKYRDALLDRALDADKKINSAWTNWQIEKELSK